MQNKVRTAAKIGAVVFDFDATLVDSEPNWFKADKRLFAEYGIDLTGKMKNEFIGKSLHHMVRTLCERYNLQVDEDLVREKKNQYYLEIARGNTHIFPEMRRFYDALCASALPIAIASGTARSVIEILLDDLGIKKSFSFFLGNDDAEHGKPSPDIYLLAAKKLSLDPCEILVIEDSPHGVTAAKDAGMSCAAIPYLLDEQSDPAFERADLLFCGGMKEFDYKKVYEWAGWNLL